MPPPPLGLEIKIALIGHVSVGKTTLLNALLRDKFSEVSMRRTTVGVNRFRLSQKPPNKRRKTDSPVSTLQFASAESTLEEISEDNRRRDQAGIEEKTFDVELDEPLCDMREDTNLMLIDLPGVDEAGSIHNYEEYVAQNWKEFDCAIIMMDSHKGANTQDQLELLELVQECQETKKIPLIIVANKVDEPDDEERQELVKELREEVEKIFGVKDRTRALDAVLKGKAAPTGKTVFPIFLPMSAIHAFIHRATENMTLPRFKRFDRDLVELLGREEIGRSKWKKMSTTDKYKAAYSVLTTPGRDGLAASRIDDFLQVFRFCIGGSRRQQKLLEIQVEVALQDLIFSESLTEQLRPLYRESLVLGMPIAPVKARFWSVYDEESAVALSNMSSILTTGATQPARPMAQLVEYGQWVHTLGWKDEMEKVQAAMVYLIQAHLKVVFDEWNNPTTKPNTTWFVVVESLLAASFSRFFSLHFGPEKVCLENIKLQCRTDDIVGKPCPKCNRAISKDDACHTCKLDFKETRPGHRFYGYKYMRVVDRGILLTQKYENGRLSQKNPAAKADHMKIPTSPMDPEHHGHLLWQFCCFMEAYGEMPFAKLVRPFSALPMPWQTLRAGSVRNVCPKGRDRKLDNTFIFFDTTAMVCSHPSLESCPFTSHRRPTIPP